MGLLKNGPRRWGLVTEELEGTVDSLVYTNEETGYAVLRLRSAAGPVTAVGNLVSPVPGERVRLKGQWIEHPRFGRQFRVEEYETRIPATTEGIERYLGSGLIQGIGPRIAGSIVDAFGGETLEVLDLHPERLVEIEGIGRKRMESIRQAWEGQKEIRRIMIFLQSYGTGPALAAKIYKRYGNHSVGVVQENPYRLAFDVFGVGFLTADRIAQKMGLPQDSIARAEAGVLQVIQDCASEGHVYFPRIRLIQRAQKMLEIDRAIVGRAVDSLREAGRLVVEELPPAVQPTGAVAQREPAVYLPALHTAEIGIAAFLRELQSRSRTPQRDIGEMAQRALAWTQRRMDIVLAEKQIEAIDSALRDRVTIITGGPGTGKTTIIRALLAILDRARFTTLLGAPTGRAAKRLQEASGHEAMTIHRLLDYSPREGGFRKNREDRLVCDWLIVDETSMVDVVLMYHLLKAVPANSSLVLVGDADQLPSVGAGCVLKDLIASGSFPVAELNEVFRQAEASRIVVNAHRINIGLMPLREPEGDFFFIQQEDPEEVLRLILKLCRVSIPRRFQMDSINDIQVLSPMHRGVVGVTNLNRVLQEALNPGKTVLSQGGLRLKRGDKVMQIRNNYDKEVFNGDVGRLETIDPRTRSVTVLFEDRGVSYDNTELDELALAYAVSVHKAQGSEFPAVIVPVVSQHYLLLQRNLIYTAVSRGKKLVVLVGTRKALAIALKNTDTRDRLSGLKDRLSAMGRA
jgi:exodeoxyribonuclease V alpha subunit